MAERDMNLAPGVWEPTDYEVYCWLKRELPAEFEVLAEPQAGYFSEWRYRYRVLKAGEVVAEWSGDFRDDSSRGLSDEVQQFVLSLGVSEC